MNLSMLRYFFEKPVNGSSNMHLFEDKLIMDQGEEYICYQEQYHQKKVIILIDEYDVPLENAYYSASVSFC